MGALLGRATHHAFAQALSTVDTAVLPAKTLQSRMVTDRALLGLVLGGVAQRLALEQALLRNAVLLPGSERLRDIAARLPRGATLTGTTLAGLLGVRPETLSRLNHGPAEDHHLPIARAALAELRPPLRSGRRTFPSGKSLPMDSNCMILIWSGRVRLFVCGRDGRELYIATLGAGDLLNLASTLGAPPLDLRATAETTTVIQEMPPSEFLQFLESDRAMVRAITRRLIDRVVALEERSARARSASTSEMLALRLHELSESEDGPAVEWAELTGHWTHAALAHEIGRTRESVTRALTQLEQAGYLRRQGRRLFVHRRRVAQDFEIVDSSVEPEAYYGASEASGHTAATRF
jgi:CRP-like cAMP-binding protein